MTTNFQFNNGGTVTDTDDVFIRRDLFSTGGLWLWGKNSDGQLGINDRVHRSSPIQTISGGTNWKLVASGAYANYAIKTDGTLWAWGANNLGQLGDNTTLPKSSPIQTISGGSNWKLVANGSYAVASIKTDGTLWMWGTGLDGVLGDNTVVSKSSPIQTVAGGTTWKQVALGLAHTVAVKTDGTLWAWGRNGVGQLGTNDQTHRSSPVQTISGGTNWKQVAAGSIWSAAIKTDGTLWTWGSNLSGYLGTNDRVHRSSPVQTVAGGTNWKSVFANRLHTAAIKTDGTLWSWGTNSSGQLGCGDVVDRSSPVQTVSGGTNWKYLATGYFMTAAIKTDGTLWVWGNNGNGQLGDNTVISKSSPIQTIAGGTNWKAITAGYTQMQGIREDYY